MYFTLAKDPQINFWMVKYFQLQWEVSNIANKKNHTKRKFMKNWPANLFLCFILFEVVVLETMGLEKRRGCIFHLTLHSYFNVASTSSSVFLNAEASLFMRYGNFVVVLMIIFLIAAFPGVVFSSYPMYPNSNTRVTSTEVVASS